MEENSNRIAPIKKSHSSQFETAKISTHFIIKAKTYLFIAFTIEISSDESKNCIILIKKKYPIYQKRNLNKYFYGSSNFYDFQFTKFILISIKSELRNTQKKKKKTLKKTYSTLFLFFNDFQTSTAFLKAFHLFFHLLYRL